LQVSFKDQHDNQHDNQHEFMDMTISMTMSESQAKTECSRFNSTFNTEINSKTQAIRIRNKTGINKLTRIGKPRSWPVDFALALEFQNLFFRVYKPNPRLKISLSIFVRSD